MTVSIDDLYTPERIRMMNEGLKRLRKQNRKAKRDQRERFRQYMETEKQEVVPLWQVDRTGWTPGPWDTERDRIEWRDKKTGLPCLIVRNRFGTLCGYAGVPPTHQLFGIDRNDCPGHCAASGSYDCGHSPSTSLRVHGGVTYAASCSGPICHVAKPGEPLKVWWFGFDCSHAGDFNPGTDAALRDCRDGKREIYDHEAALAKSAAGDWWTNYVYRDQAYVTAEVERLASQLASYRPTKSVAGLRQYRKRYIRRGIAKAL